MLTALPAAQTSPPSWLHPAAQQGCALLAWGSGTVVHQAPVPQPLCPHGDVPETPLQHHHSLCSLGTGTRHLPQLQGPQHLSGNMGLPLQAARPRSPHGVPLRLCTSPSSLLLTNPEMFGSLSYPWAPKDNFWCTFLNPRRLSSRYSKDSSGTRDGSPGTSSALFPSHLQVHPWVLLPPLVPWPFPSLPAQGHDPPQGQKPPWHHHSHPLGHVQAGQEHLKGEGSW